MTKRLLLGMVLAWEDLRERDAVFFFKSCEATFLVVVAFLKEMLLRIESLDFKERDER